MEPAPPPPSRSRLLRRFIVGLLLGVLVLVAFSLYADVRDLRQHLQAFDWLLLVPVIGLTLLNYLLRFLKWHYLLGRAGVRVARARSLHVFLAGLSMAVTPGKVGELLKCYLLKSSDDVPAARTAPVVVAERLTDLIALLLLCLAGFFTYATNPGLRLLLGICAGLVLALTAVLASPRLLGALLRLVARLPVLRRAAPRFEEFRDAMAASVAPVPLALTTLVSAAAWLCECVGLWLVIAALPGASAALGLAIFIYAATTVLGALSFLPGGLGVTEGSMALLLVRAASGMTRSLAVAATLIIRLCTLWLGVLLGWIALALFRRHPFSRPRQ